LENRWASWRVDDRKLLSLLEKVGDGLEYVALDPMPDGLEWLPLGLISLSLYRFMRLLINRG